MLVLGIDTSTAQVGVAIGGHEGVLAQAHSSRGKRHAENLTPAIDFVRRQARIDLQDISCVAVDLGPGLFTGLRVGVASAKAIAYFELAGFLSAAAASNPIASAGSVVRRSIEQIPRT